jgi:hypothetical protein
MVTFLRDTRLRQLQSSIEFRRLQPHETPAVDFALSVPARA